MTLSDANDQRRLGAPFLWLAFLVGMAVAGFVVFLSWQVGRGFDETRALRAEVIRSYENRAGLERILSLHRDMETGQRGYVLTGDPQFLAPNDDAVRPMQASFDRLRTTWRDSASRMRELAELERLSALKRQFAEETIGSTRAGNVVLARERIGAGTGRRLMDGIRRTIATLDGAERNQLARRTQTAERARERLQTRIVVLQVVLILLLGGALALLVRAYRGWQRTLRQISVADLYLRVGVFGLGGGQWLEQAHPFSRLTAHARGDALLVGVVRNRLLRLHRRGEQRRRQHRRGEPQRPDSSKRLSREISSSGMKGLIR